MKKLLLLFLIAPMFGFGKVADFYLLPLEIVGFQNIVKALDKVEIEELSYKVVKN